jgi:putative Holliday junction resolvase
VGLALSDPLGIIARPFSVVETASPETLLAELSRVICEQEVGKVVVGLPLRMDGSEGDAAKEVKEFAGMLGERIDVPVELWDERLSTVQAERAMLSADLSRADRKKRRDKIAAQVFLQSYLDAHRNASP